MIKATWFEHENEMFFALMSPILTVGHTNPEGEVYVEEEINREDLNETLMLIRAVLYNPHFMNRHKLIKQLRELEELLEAVKKEA